MQTEKAEELKQLDSEYSRLFSEKRAAVDKLALAIDSKSEKEVETYKQEVLKLQDDEKALREAVKGKISEAIPGAKTQDRDYIFLNFVLNNLPHGIIGLLIAVMFLAAMSSMAGELSALSSTTSVDVYKRLLAKDATQEHYLKASRGFTALWALIAIVFAMLASFAENLIQFVNIVGSLFYGTILGIFLVAFYIKRIQGTAVFWAAIIAEAVVLYCYFFTDLAFLLYNIIGCVVVIVVAYLLQMIVATKTLKH
jgi:Na+/proline symporter